jgi:hypothetical protein
MPEPSEIDELSCKLRVNGLLVQSVHVRCVPELADDFQIVITDPQIGSFSLHGGFELEMREEGSSWRTVTLEQLTKAITGSSEFLQAEDLPMSSEMAERRLFDRIDDVDIPHQRSPRLNQLTGQDECVREVQRVLREARVPHRVSGTVFVVPSAFRARICLLRAGFRKSTIAPTALVEPVSARAVLLVERRF